MRNEKDFEIVGDIPIKMPKNRKKKNKKKNSSETSIGMKILVWFMFFAMAFGSIVPLVYYLVSIITQEA